MNLQKGWERSMARLNSPVARKAAAFKLRAVEPEGKAQRFRLEGRGAPVEFLAERIAAMLFGDMGRPVAVVIQFMPSGESIRGYCDGGTRFNAEVIEEARYG